MPVPGSTLKNEARHSAVQERDVQFGHAAESSLVMNLRFQEKVLVVLKSREYRGSTTTRRIENKNLHRELAATFDKYHVVGLGEADFVGIVLPLP